VFTESQNSRGWKGPLWVIYSAIGLYRAAAVMHNLVLNVWQLNWLPGW